MIFQDLTPSRWASKNGPGEFFRVEGAEVFQAFADADVAHGNLQLIADGHGDASLGRAVELGQNEACHSDGFLEEARLGKSVLPRGGVEDQPGFVRRPFHLALQGAVDFFELFHGVHLGVHAPRRVQKEHVHVPRHGRIHGVEGHR